MTLSTWGSISYIYSLSTRVTHGLVLVLLEKIDGLPCCLRYILGINLRVALGTRCFPRKWVAPFSRQDYGWNQKEYHQPTILRLARNFQTQPQKRISYLLYLLAKMNASIVRFFPCKLSSEVYGQSMLRAPFFRNCQRALSSHSFGQQLFLQITFQIIHSMCVYVFVCATVHPCQVALALSP